MAPVVLAIQARPDVFEHVLATTGQHRDMVSPVLDAFSLEAQIDLDLMEHDQTLAGFASLALGAIARAIESCRPDIVLVQGDTSSAMVASLAAFYARVGVGHVEAGLRTHDRDNPFPEELNRRLIGSMATWHFAPTESARQNLLSEGVGDSAIYVTGNTIVDALSMLDLSEQPSVLDGVPATDRIILATVHRRESIGAPMRAIFGAIRRIAEARDDVRFIVPVHPNPSVSQTARALLADAPRTHLVEPLGYRELLAVMKRSAIVLTDSGGIQEEAPSFHVPVLVLRDVTERPELIESGAGILVGTNEEHIVNVTLRLLGDSRTLDSMRTVANPFGDGLTAQRIVDVLVGATK